MQVSSFLDKEGNLVRILSINHSELSQNTVIFILLISDSTTGSPVKSVTKIASRGGSGVEVILPDQEGAITLLAKKMPTGRVEIFSPPLMGKVSFVVGVIENGSIGGPWASWLNSFSNELKGALGVA